VDEVKPLIDYVNIHIDSRLHKDVPVYFYDSESFREVINLTGVRVCGSPVSEVCLEEYRRYIVKTGIIAFGRYFWNGRFILMNWSMVRAFPRFSWLAFMFHETLHSVFDALNLWMVYVDMFKERFSRYDSLLRELIDRGLYSAYSDVFTALGYVLNEFFVVVGEGTFLTYLRRDCFRDRLEALLYLSGSSVLRSAVGVANEIMRPYWVQAGVEPRELSIDDLFYFYGRVCEDVKSVLDVLPVEDYDYWQSRYGFFDGMELHKILYWGRAD